MWKFTGVWFIVLLLAGCVSGPPWDRKTPTAEQLVGEYAMSWGGVCYEVELRADRTYAGKDCAGGHFGPTDGPDRHFAGDWRLEGALLHFSSIGPLGDLDLGPAEAFFYKGQPAFVELDFVHDGKVSATPVFKRQASD